MLTAASVLVGIRLTTPAAAVSGLDHFLCYTAKAVKSTATSGFTPPSSVSLKNQLSSFNAAPAVVVIHCNPVQKTVPGVGVTPITNPDAHLLCWSILVSQQPSVTVTVTNQFGTGELTVGQPKLLCLPSWKSPTGPPNKAVVRPPGLDHFTCYPVSYVAGGAKFAPPPLVVFKDQFGTFETKIGKPILLCSPTQKTTPSGVVTPITNPDAHLLCFALKFKFPPKPLTVFDQNQFGTGAVLIRLVATLCVPSGKTIVPPTTTTTTIPPTTTTTCSPLGCHGMRTTVSLHDND
jgi:hypothetical protein